MRRTSFYIDENLCVWISGDNENGQLGLGDYINRKDYTKITGIDKIQQAAASTFITALLDVTGCVWVTGMFGCNYTKIEDTPEIIQVECCTDFILLLDINNCVWMYDKNGILSKIPNIHPIQQINCNERVNILLLDLDGNVWYFTQKNMRSNDLKKEKGFEKLQNLHEIKTISVGPRYILFLDTKGNVWYCTFASNIPTKIKNLPEITQIASNPTYRFASDADGNVWLLNLYNSPTMLTRIPKIQQIYSSFMLDVNSNLWKNEHVFTEDCKQINNTEGIIGINCPVKKPNKTKSSRNYVIDIQ